MEHTRPDTPHVALALPAALPTLLTRTRFWVALVVAGFGITAAAGLTDGVLEHGDLSVFDPTVMTDISSWRGGGLTVVANVLTYWGSTPAVGLLGMVLIAWVWFEWRDRLGAVVLTGSLGVAAVLTYVVKQLVGRPRPPADVVLGAADSSPAFPSGHTLGTTVLLGLLAVAVLFHARSRAVKVVAVAGGVAGSVLVAASRLYLGYHWLTDVLAGLSLGILVVGATLVTIEVLRVRRPNWDPFRPVEPGS